MKFSAFSKTATATMATMGGPGFESLTDTTVLVVTAKEHFTTKMIQAALTKQDEEEQAAMTKQDEEHTETKEEEKAAATARKNSENISQQTKKEDPTNQRILDGYKQKYGDDIDYVTMIAYEDENCQNLDLSMIEIFGRHKITNVPQIGMVLPLNICLDTGAFSSDEPMNIFLKYTAEELEQRKKENTFPEKNLQLRQLGTCDAPIFPGARSTFRHVQYIGKPLQGKPSGIVEGEKVLNCEMHAEALNNMVKAAEKQDILEAEGYKVEEWPVGECISAAGKSIMYVGCGVDINGEDIPGYSAASHSKSLLEGRNGEGETKDESEELKQEKTVLIVCMVVNAIILIFGVVLLCCLVRSARKDSGDKFTPPSSNNEESRVAGLNLKENAAMPDSDFGIDNPDFGHGTLAIGHPGIGKPGPVWEQNYPTGV